MASIMRACGALVLAASLLAGCAPAAPHDALARKEVGEMPLHAPVVRLPVSRARALAWGRDR